MFVFGVIFILVIGIMIFGFFVGFTTFHIHKKPTEGQIRVACVGDSITYGCGVKNWPKNCYPAVLQRKLGMGYCVNNYGYSGRTLLRSADCPYVNKAVFRQSLEFEPDIVVVKLGTNDAKKKNWKGKETFKEEYRWFLRHYSSLKTNPKIYLCTPSTVYYDNGTAEGEMVQKLCIPSDNIKEAGRAAAELGEELNYEVIDLYTLTGGHREWFTEGIHPNVEGAEKIAEEVYRHIKRGEENGIS